jgi:hypothetical protein
MSIPKAVGYLMLLYLLIAAPAVWQVRKICLIERDDCDYHGLLDTVASSWSLLVSCLLVIGSLVFFSAYVYMRARDNTLEIEQDSPGREFNVNGYLVLLVVFPLYFGGSLVVLLSAAKALESSSFEAIDSFFWKSIWATMGSLIVFSALWHFNEYLVKPASRILLFLLFFLTLGSISWIVKSTLLPP